MKSIAFYTLGCKVNQYETQAIEEMFVDAGYTVVDFTQTADIYLINTCTVTRHSDSKSRQVIRRAKRQNPRAMVVVIGCYVQASPDEVLAIPGVDLVTGTADKYRIVQLVDGARGMGKPVKAVRDIEQVREFEEMKLERAHRGRTRAYVKIQEGCRQFCTYCIIPHVRGPLRSRRPDRIMEQVSGLAALGYKEVVLTGIHVTSYGKDLAEDTGLLDILKMLHDIDGLRRIRLSSLEPTYFTERIADEISQLGKVCRHFHLSLQSGCDETLRRMGRGYTTGQYRSIVQMLRDRMPQVAVTTDVMVGFPGETPEEFRTTYRFLEEIGLSNMHIFKYSARKGTPAVRYEGQVDSKTKEERSAALLGLASGCRKAFHDRFVSRRMEVLFEQPSGEMDGYFEGLTDNYIKVLVPFAQGLSNEIIEVKLVESRRDYIIGELD